MEHILICCVCLGDNSEDSDEIIQCDNCGVTVHEGRSAKHHKRFYLSMNPEAKIHPSLNHEKGLQTFPKLYCDEVAIASVSITTTTF